MARFFLKISSKAKIVDFGFAKIAKMAHTEIGTVGYLAPEIITKNYTNLVDIFSLGATALDKYFGVLYYYIIFKKPNNLLDKFLGEALKKFGVKKIEDPDYKDLKKKLKKANRFWNEKPNDLLDKFLGAEAQKRFGVKKFRDLKNSSNNKGTELNRDEESQNDTLTDKDKFIMIREMLEVSVSIPYKFFLL